MSEDTIPEDVLLKIKEAKEKQLEKLDLSYSNLTRIPEEVFELTNIKILDLSNNKIDKLPESIDNLSNLIDLHLSDNQLKKLPESIGRLSNLVELRAWRNKLEEIPKSIGNLKNLTWINLGENKLEELPESIGELSSLTRLPLVKNQLTKLPESIGNLKNLTELDLSENQLTKLPESICNLKNLAKLNLGKNQLKEIPESICNLFNLVVLDLWKNQLEEIPESIGNLSNLFWLNLGNNKLTNIPESIGKLSKLTDLYLSNNQLVNLPDVISNLSSVLRLYIQNNQLIELPECLDKLSNLTCLDLWGNQLKSLPESICNLSNLNSLNLGMNQLENLPESISNLSGLTWLNLNNNNLVKLPESISKLSRLIWLHLENNPLETPPIEVASKGINAIKEYFQQLNKEGEDYLYEAKLLIVGEPAAGKTSLAKKIQDPNYELQADEAYTQGIDVINWSFPLDEEREFKVNIWDFGGNVIYYATHKFFLTQRSLYILVADSRKEDTDFYYWLNIVELLSNNSPLLIIKNEKQDHTRDINERALRGQFSNLRKTLATNLADNRGLKEILADIKYYIQTLPHIGQTLPKTWVKVRQVLKNYSHNRNYISLKEYLDICEKNGFTRLEDKLQLSEYLHDLGICLHFQDEEDSLLYKIVILEPKWCTDAVYRVLNNQQVINSKGHFTRNDLKNIWQEAKYTSVRGELLELMKRFQLCYKISDPNREDTFIAPQLLSDNQPEYDWNESQNLILFYAYPDFMPQGIITRFVVIMHQYIDQQEYVWKTGVILNKDNTKAEVIEDHGKRKIRIRVSGNNQRDFMTVITHELDKINNLYKRLNFHKLIPCNCQDCKNTQEPHFYSFKTLQNLEKKTNDVQCLKSGEMVKIKKLIDDVIDPDKSPEIIPKPNKIIPKPNNKIKIIKIFLASSSELQDDRKEFEIFICRKNKEYIKDAVFLELLLWEDFLNAMSPTRSQDEYNKAVAGCDVFVSLFHTKVGRYTNEEFLKALETFKANSKPLIFTYFKDEAIKTSEITPTIMSLLNFKKKLEELGHFYTNYADINDLKLQFNNQLTKFLPKQS